MIDSIVDDIWVQALSEYSKIYVGFSGGLDSTALLYALAVQPAFFGKIYAIHIHHGLSDYANEWEAHCKKFCDDLNIPLLVNHLHLQSTSNLEETARLARHQVFQSVVSDKDCLLLAHHQNDQAETLLLNLMRGAGIDGLSAMKPVHRLGSVTVYRPLLSCSRDQILSYAQYWDLSWIEDDSNQNETFSRNFLRHRVMPLLHEVWPAASQNIARAAKHCQDAQFNLDALAHMDCPELSDKSDTLSIEIFKKLSDERMMNVLRAWLKNNLNSMPSTAILNRVVHEVIYARTDTMSCVDLNGRVIRRYQNRMYCLKTLMPERLIPKREDFPKNLDLPVGSQIDVCFRKGGETLRWKGQTKLLKKLFQEWQIPPWMRDAVPLIYCDGELAAVFGYAVSDNFFKKSI